MVSLYVSKTDSLQNVRKLITAEIATAVNIKSKINKSSVITVLKTILNKLNLITANTTGLAIFCGIDTDETLQYVEYTPTINYISQSKYLCDNKFHTEFLDCNLHDTAVYGYIVINGDSTLFGTLSGLCKRTIYKFDVDLPKKHGRGGQSAQRFGRIRLEKRQNYITKVSELANKLFINSSTNMPNVKNIIIAGSADLKQQLFNSDVYDARLHTITNSKLIDVSASGENGFSQAIELTKLDINNMQFLNEKNTLAKWFTSINLNDNMTVFGFRECINALINNNIDELFIDENFKLPTNASVVFEEFKFQITDNALRTSVDTKNNYENITTDEFFDYLLENYKKHEIKHLHIISKVTSEGAMFVDGFGGFGGLLKCAVYEESSQLRELINSHQNCLQFTSQICNYDFDEDFC